ncbi:type II toxin-antitoxin system VapC family toxin [Flexivirga caeni]|uniref:Ribonuclease VapC n=1 Tax=Flexivirga caeni TaxID=2294115 RepID=A0A3M9MCD2_9MICO|nr:type II toxin-antitoxin system VapC family toxin [Flexivirga caeni]RNI22855.1 type II toxin-antitoxin system VapC family toxin [Flexivirga caeni]
MIILDTNVVSELMRAHPQQCVIDWTDRQAPETLYLTTLNLAEIRFGIAALPRGARRTRLAAAFENGIRPLFGDRILGFDQPASIAYASLRADARTRGLAVGDADTLIAAIALAHRFAVATRDVAPFEATGLQVIDPFA